MPRLVRGLSASTSAAVLLAPERCWSRSTASTWPAVRLGGGTVMVAGAELGFAVVVRVPGAAGAGGAPGAPAGDVGAGTRISLVSGAVVGAVGGTVVGAAVVGGTVVGGGAVVVVVADELGGTVMPGGSWAPAPGSGPPKSDAAASVAATRMGRGSEIRTEVNRWLSAASHVTRHPARR
jgi:hypothetical protein